MDFTKKKELEALRQEAISKYDAYKLEAELIKGKTNLLYNELNQWMGVINGERQFLREEIYTLHDFLSKFNDAGEKLTPFDFTVDFTHIKEDGNLKGNVGFSDDTKGSKAALAGGVLGAAGVAVGTPMLLAGPVLAAPSLLALPIQGIFARGENKKKIQQLTEGFNNSRIEWANDIYKKRFINGYYLAVIEIAKLYHGCMASVKDAIKRQILPELQAVRSFFFADAVKENVLYDNDASVAPLSVEMYKDTPYEKHYLFVKNAHAFYKLICAYFTKRYFVDLLNEETISDSFEYNFENNINIDEVDFNDSNFSDITNEADKVEKELDQIKENIMFTEVD